MDTILQILFNTNHEMPSGWVLAVLAGLAIALPSFMRYCQNRREEKRRQGNGKKG